VGLGDAPVLTASQCRDEPRGKELARCSVVPRYCTGCTTLIPGSRVSRGSCFCSTECQKIHSPDSQRTHGTEMPHPMRDGLVVVVFVKLKLHGVDHGGLLRLIQTVLLPRRT
jgi:predicted nucleic acid-binding Zn ribbon protein